MQGLESVGHPCPSCIGIPSFPCERAKSGPLVLSAARAAAISMNVPSADVCPARVALMQAERAPSWGAVANGHVLTYRARPRGAACSSSSSSSTSSSGGVSALRAAGPATVTWDTPTAAADDAVAHQLLPTWSGPPGGTCTTIRTPWAPCATRAILCRQCIWRQRLWRQRVWSDTRPPECHCSPHAAIAPRSHGEATAHACRTTNLTAAPHV